MANNPWQVDSIHSFSIFKCPECIFDSKEEDNFQDHATENHPLSFMLFGKTSQLKDSTDSLLKEEPKVEIIERGDFACPSDNNYENYEDGFSEVKSKLSDDNDTVLEEIEQNRCFEQNAYQKGDKADSMTAKLAVDIAAPSEIHESDNLVTISEPIQMLKSVKNRLRTKNDSGNKQKSEKHYRIASKTIKTRPQQLKVCEANYTSAQLNKKIVKKEHKLANNTKENKNVTIDNKSKQFLHNTCPICKKNFFDRPGLNRHIRTIHEKIKIAKCDLCSQAFNTEWSKNRHIKSVHEGKIYDCNECEKEFSYPASLLKHKKKHHNNSAKDNQVKRVHETIVEDRKKSYNCKLCDYQCEFSTEMKNHISSVHEENVMFKCYICKIGFNCNDNLKTHLSTHGEGNRFECVICDVSCVEKNELQKHIKSVHGKIVPLDSL